MTKKATKEKTPFFSVIIPTYNRKKLLLEALNSVLLQDFTNFEVLIINDAGEPLGNEIKKLDERIKLIDHKENLGLAESRNIGIKNAKGKWLAFLDDDDLYYPAHLSSLYKQISNHDETNLVINSCLRSVYVKELGMKKVSETLFALPKDKNFFFHANPPSCSFAIKSSFVKSGKNFPKGMRSHEDRYFFLSNLKEIKMKSSSEITSEYRSFLDKERLSFDSNIMYLTAKRCFDELSHMSRYAADNETALKLFKNYVEFWDSMNKLKAKNLIEISKLHENDEKIFIFGASNFGQQVYQTLKALSPSKVFVFLDNFKEKLRLGDKEILIKNGDYLKELKKEKLIIASTVALKEIHQQIAESGNTPLVTFPI